MAIISNATNIKDGGGGFSSIEYVDARNSVSSSGFSFEPNAAYAAYRLINSLSESLVDIINALNSSQELVNEINSYLDLYYASIQMLVAYSDYITPFLTKFQSYISNISIIDSSFGLAFNLLLLSEGEIDLELINNKTYNELQQINTDYSLICEWSNKTGSEDAKKYYTLDDLKNGDEELYYMFMEYFSIQYWATTKGYQYGEFPCNSYLEFKNKGQVKLPSVENVPKLPLPDHGRNSSEMLFIFDGDVETYVSYDSFSYEMPSLELFYFEMGISDGGHDLSKLSKEEATTFLNWSYWRNDEIYSKSKTLGFSIKNSYDATNAISELDQKVDVLWDAVFEYKVADVGTASLNFMKDGMYSYNHKHFDRDAEDYIVGYIYINTDGRKDFVFVENSMEIANDNNIDRSTIQEVKFSDYAEHKFYQEFRTQFMSDSNFDDNWYNSELYLQATEMQQERETKLVGALEAFDNENSRLTELKSLNSLVNDLAQQNVETAMVTWKPDFEKFSKEVDFSDKISTLLDNSYVVYPRGDCSMATEDGEILLSDAESLDIIYALISDSYCFESDMFGCLYFYNDKDECIGIYGNQLLHNYVLWNEYMSDTEKAVFYYKYAKGDKEDCIAYLDDLSSSLNARYVAARTQSDETFATDNPFLASCMSVFVTPVEGWLAALYSLSSLATGEKMYTTYTYSSGDVYRRTVSANIAANDVVWGETLSFLYNTGMSIVDSSLLLATNLITGGSMTLLLSASLMGSRAYVSTLNNALDRGLSDGQAVALAFSAAAAESICESISVGKLLDLDNTLNSVLGSKLAGIDNKTVHSIVKVFGGAIIQGISEGEEEVCTELLNYLTDSLISGDLSAFRLSVEEKIANGYSESDAIAEAIRENFEQVMLAFLGGFISGGFNGGIFTTASTIKSELDISKMATDINSMYKNSTVNYDIKSLQLNLRHGNYVEAFNGLLGFDGVDITTKLLASKRLYQSLSSSVNLDYFQQRDIESKISDGLRQFSGLSQAQQLEQFNKLNLDNQITLLNMLDSNATSVFNSLSAETQQILFNNNKLNLSVKLSILSSLDSAGQSVLLPQGTNVVTYIANNSSEIINAQVNSIDSNISKLVSELKNILFNNQVQLVNDINIKYFDSLLSSVMKNPSEISSLIQKYSSGVNSLNVDTYNKLMLLLSDNINARYNLIHSNELANSIMQKDSSLDYNNVLATLIIPSNMHSKFGLDYSRLFSVESENVSESKMTDLEVIMAGLKDGTITEGQVHQLFNDFVGGNLSSWVLNEESATSLYINLLTAAQNAGIPLSDVQSCIGVLDSMSKYYEVARDGLKDKLESGKGFFNTYRTHGIVHAMDVLTQSINAYTAFKAAGIENLSLKTIMLSAVMHDTGMSGGKEIYFIVNDQGKLEPWIKDEAKADGGIYRKSHSFNSAVDIILEFEALRNAGYTDLEIAEAAILTFAHSKSNSGLKSLSDNEAGWSFAIQALAAATKDCEFDIVDVLMKNGVIKSSDTSLENFSVPNPSGKVTGIIEVYDFNLDWIKTAGYESLIVRIGDALTNNDNADTNQYGKPITFDSTNYNAQLSFSEIMSRNGIDVSLSVDEQLLALLQRFKTSDDNLKLTYLSLAETEAANVTYEIDGEETNKSPQFVLGENNQTYRIEAVSDSEVEVVVSIKHSEAVPFCTIFAIDERAGELISKGDLLFNQAVDGKTIRMIIEIDSTTSDAVKALYQQYADNAGIDVEVREVNKLAEIKDSAVIVAGVKDGTISKYQLSQLFNNYLGDYVNGLNFTGDMGYSFYMNLLNICNNTGIEISDVKKLGGLLDSMVEVTILFSELDASNFVLETSANGMQKIKINDVQLEKTLNSLIDKVNSKYKLDVSLDMICEIVVSMNRSLIHDFPSNKQILINNFQNFLFNFTLINTSALDNASHITDVAVNLDFKLDEISLINLDGSIDVDKVAKLAGKMNNFNTRVIYKYNEYLITKNIYQMLAKGKNLYEVTAYASTARNSVRVVSQTIMSDYIDPLLKQGTNGWNVNYKTSFLNKLLKSSTDLQMQFVEYMHNCGVCTNLQLFEAIASEVKCNMMKDKNMLSVVEKFYSTIIASDGTSNTSVVSDEAVKNAWLQVLKGSVSANDKVDSILGLNKFQNQDVFETANKIYEFMQISDLSVVEDFVNNGKITKGIVKNILTSLVDNQLGRWVLSDDAAYKLYLDLLSNCNKAGFKITDITNLIGNEFGNITNEAEFKFFCKEILGYDASTIDAYYDIIDSNAKYDANNIYKWGDYKKIVTLILDGKINLDDIGFTMDLDDFKGLGESKQLDIVKALDATKVKETIIKADLIVKRKAAAQTLMQIKINDFAGDMYEVGYTSDRILSLIVDARNYKYSIKSKNIVINGIDYTQYFPKCDEFISYICLKNYTMELLDLSVADLQQFATVNGLEYKAENEFEILAQYLKANEGKKTVEGLIFQNAKSGESNFVRFNGNVGNTAQLVTYTIDGINYVTEQLTPVYEYYDELGNITKNPSEARTKKLLQYTKGYGNDMITIPLSNIKDIHYDYNISGGAYMLLKSPKDLAAKYSDLCTYDEVTGKFTILNMKEFGDKVLGGVPLDNVNGTYMITCKIPFNSNNISIPSINNGSMYPAYGVPGGYLLDGEQETVISGTAGGQTIIDKVTKDGTGKITSDDGKEMVIEIIK